MAVRYGSPFKLFSVLLEPQDPRAGKRRQLRDREAALRLAQEVARRAKVPLEEVFWESTVYYVKEYLRVAVPAA